MNKLSEQATDAIKENSTTQVLETIEFTETIDLSPLAGEEGYTEIELPSFHQKLLALQAEDRKVRLKDIRISLTNLRGESFGGSDSDQRHWFMFDWCIRNKNVRISRVIFQSHAYYPFLNTILVYFYYQDDPEKSDAIGRISWRKIDGILWSSYWTKGVTLTYSVDFES